jgi:hypothetical protein
MSSCSSEQQELKDKELPVSADKKQEIIRATASG